MCFQQHAAAVTVVEYRAVTGNRCLEGMIAASTRSRPLQDRRHPYQSRSQFVFLGVSSQAEIGHLRHSSKENVGVPVPAFFSRANYL